jgi:hypothetical protein
MVKFLKNLIGARKVSAPININPHYMSMSDSSSAFIMFFGQVKVGDEINIPMKGKPMKFRVDRTEPLKYSNGARSSAHVSRV